MKFTIIGAGMAGLLAGGMLRYDCERVVERVSELPNNHSALLRFRSSIVGDTLNIKFSKVRVMKAISSSCGNPIADAISYSLKSNGLATLRSSISANGEIEERYIAPPDLINQMANLVQCGISFGTLPSFSKSDLSSMKTISTIPMPNLMEYLRWKQKPNFKYTHGLTVSANVPSSDICATLYYPRVLPKVSPYRASLTKQKLIIEFAFPKEPKAGMERERSMIEFESPEIVDQVLADFGMGKESVNDISIDVQKYAKILPINDDIRKQFIMWATEEFGIYSLGRFATWRPGLLLDDVVNDVRVIQSIANKGLYQYKLNK